MYTAMLLLCYAQTLTNCVQVDDSWGPYRTIEECEARIVDMAAASKKISPYMVAVAAKCDYKSGKST